MKKWMTLLPITIFAAGGALLGFASGCSNMTALNDETVDGNATLDNNTRYELKIDNISYANGDHLVRVLPISSSENKQTGVAHIEYSVSSDLTEKYGFAVTTKKDSSSSKIVISCSNSYQFRGGNSLVTIYADIDKININGSVTVQAEVIATTKFEVDIDGASDVSVTNIYTTETTVNVDGAAKVTLSGASTSVKINLDGAGTINTKGLIAANADVDLDGAGTILVYCTQSLDVKLEGVGSITYYGNPASVLKDLQGVGTLKAGS